MPWLEIKRQATTDLRLIDSNRLAQEAPQMIGRSKGKRATQRGLIGANRRRESVQNPQPHFCCWREEPEVVKAIRHWRSPAEKRSFNLTSNFQPTTAPASQRCYKRSPAKSFSDGSG